MAKVDAESADIQYTALEAMPAAQAARKEIERQERRGNQPSFRRIITAVGVDRANGDVWIALYNTLLHFDRRVRYNFGTTEGEISGERIRKRRSAKHLGFLPSLFEGRRSIQLSYGRTVQSIVASSIYSHFFEHFISNFRCNRCNNGFFR